VPDLLIGRQLEVPETRIGSTSTTAPLVAWHQTVFGRTFTRVTVSSTARRAAQSSPEEQALARADPPVRLCRGTLALRRLLALSREYPRAAFLQAVTLAEQYGLFDLDRLERLTLRFVAQAYFVLSDHEEP
jgi:hypothetical protein